MFLSIISPHEHLQSHSFWSLREKNSPISFPLPSGQMAHRMISVPEATATILSLSPSEPAITLALSATLSITQSRRGDVKTCCHPVDSFTLTDGQRQSFFFYFYFWWLKEKKQIFTLGNSCTGFYWNVLKSHRTKTVNNKTTDQY